MEARLIKEFFIN